MRSTRQVLSRSAPTSLRCRCRHSLTSRDRPGRGPGTFGEAGAGQEIENRLCLEVVGKRKSRAWHGRIIASILLSFPNRSLGTRVGAIVLAVHARQVLLFALVPKLLFGNAPCRETPFRRLTPNPSPHPRAPAGPHNSEHSNSASASDHRRSRVSLGCCACTPASAT